MFGKEEKKITSSSQKRERHATFKITKTIYKTLISTTHCSWFATLESSNSTRKGLCFNIVWFLRKGQKKQKTKTIMACFHHPGMTLNLLERGKMKIIVWKPTNNNPQRVISNTTILCIDQLYFHIGCFSKAMPT